MLLFAVLLMLLSGAGWTVLVVVVSRVSQRRLDIRCMQALAAVVMLLFNAVVLLCREGIPHLETSGWLILAMLITCGAGNYFMMDIVNYAMKRGNSGAVWGISQSAIILPFLMGMCFFHVAPTWPRITGIVIVLVSVALFGCARSDGRKSGRGWFLPSVAALLIAGLAQCIANLPSYWHMTTLSGTLRAIPVQCGVLICFFAGKPFRKGQDSWRGIGWLAVAYGLANAITLSFVFYKGLDILANLGAGSIGYPIGQGSAIAFFALYNTFVDHEADKWQLWTALALMCLGIALMSA